MSDKPKTEVPAADRLQAALGYLERGWAVVPVAARSKRPIVRWQPFQHKLPDEETVTRWFTRWPDANLAVVTGDVSGVVVLDVDPRHGGDTSFAALEARHGAILETIESETGGGGRHLYFAHPGREVRNRAGLAPGIDLRGDGGVIVVPPSVHPSGKPYLWKRGRGPGEIVAAPLPLWLELSHIADGGPAGHRQANWRALVQHGVTEGHRNSAVASLTGHLIWREVDTEIILELMLAWNRMRCDPPLSDDEVIRTVHSIEKTHARHRHDAGSGSD